MASAPLTIEDLKAHRAQLRGEIQSAIERFERETGVIVKSVAIGGLAPYGVNPNGTTFFSHDLEIELDL